MRKLYCDRCGVELVDDKYETVAIEYIHMHLIEHKDLCNRCKLGLLRMLEDFFNCLVVRETD